MWDRVTVSEMKKKDSEKWNFKFDKDDLYTQLLLSKICIEGSIECAAPITYYTI